MKIMADKYLKSDVYSFLDGRRDKLIKEKTIKLKEKVEDIKIKEINKAFLNTDIEKLEKLEKNIDKINKDLSKIIDNFNGGQSLYDNESNKKNKTDIKKSLLENSQFYNVSEIKELNNKINDISRSIRIEYGKLESQVRECSTASKAIRMLKEMGFNTSHIKKNEKNSLIKIEINDKLLGLPEEK